MPQGKKQATKQLTYVERLTCRGCHGTDLTTVLDLGNQYLPNFVRVIDQTLPRAPLELVACAGCGLLQLRHETDPEVLCRDYHCIRQAGGRSVLCQGCRDVPTNNQQHSHTPSR